MNKELLKILHSYEELSKNTVWDNGLLRKNGSGHTWEVAELDIVHAGRDTSLAYVFGKIIKNIDETEGIRILQSISKLQVTDKKSDRYGAFRWYAEESKPIDTNAAFFTMAPLAILMLFSPECLSKNEFIKIRQMLLCSYSWFSKECENPILFYTNKIVSDGALLAAISNITGDKEHKKLSRKFLLRWLDYTEKRGYGWGENLSRGYNGVTIQAFTLIKKALNNNLEDTQITKRFEKLEKEILDTFRFNNGYEFVPTIRSYNITGIPKSPSVLYNLAGVEKFGFIDGMNSPDKSLDISNLHTLAVTFLIYDDRLYVDKEDYIKKEYSNIQTVPRTKQTHIMDDKVAYTWIGKNGGLGSLNKFPIIEGSYQHKTWGLGWQCFPVNMIVYDKQVSFLRFNVDAGDRMRHHPHKNKHTDFLDPALFSEGFYPDVKTDCMQNENTLIAIRSINKLRNKVAHISDSLDIQRFDGEVNQYNSNGRQWTVLSYEKACICVTSLLGITVGVDEQVIGEIDIVKENENIQLVQWLYKGELKELYNDRISAGWVIHFIDKRMNQNELQNHLNSIKITDEYRPDNETPRMPIWNIQDIGISLKEDTLISFIHDPYK